MDNNQDLYRKQAIEAHFASDSYQIPLRIITPKSWLFLIAVIAIFSGVLFWLFFGTVTTQINGSGLIFSKDAKIVTVMSPEGDGYIEKILAYHGMKVKAGQIIAEISYPSLNSEIKEQKQFIENQTKKLNELKKQADNEIKIRLASIDKSIIATQDTLKTANAKRNYLAEQLKIQQEALKKGIVSRLLVSDYQVAFYNVESEVRNAETQLNKLNQEKNDYSESWSVKIREVEQKILDLQFELQKKINKSSLIRNVLSPVDGIIFTNYLKVGEHLEKQEKLADIMTYSNELELIAFIDARAAKKIKPGMPAKIFPQHIRAIKYGGIQGKVFFVSELPINQKTIETFFENKDLADNFLKQGPLIEVRIILLTSNSTVSGYKWTSSKGPPEKISFGSFAEVGIIVDKEKPISIIIPTIQNTTKWFEQ